MNRFFKLFCVGVAFAVFFVRSSSDAATYYFDLASKDIEGGTMALGESADIILRNIGESAPANLRTLLCDKDGSLLAASTNGFTAHGTAARGRMSLATTNLAARFEGMGALKEIPLVFAVWDTALGTLLGSDTVQVRNNPFADADGSVPSDWGGVDYGDKTIAQLAYAMAQLALATANSTSNRMDALQGEYESATNALWESIGSLGNATNGLAGRVDALDARVDALGEAVTNAIGDGIEAAFTNGTARGLAITPIDHEDYLSGDLSKGTGVFATIETNQYGVPIGHRLILRDGNVVYLSLSESGVETDGDMAAHGFTLGTNTVTDWNQLTAAEREAIAALDTAISGPGGITNRLQKAEAATNALDTLSRTNAAAISDIQSYTNKVGAATNALDTLVRTNAAGIADLWKAVDDLSTNGIPPYNLENLEGWLEGPAWLTPARFAWETTPLYVTTTNIGEVEDNNWSVLTRKRVVLSTPEYELRPEIERNQWDEELALEVDGPATLGAVGDGSYTLYWDEWTPTGATATVTGQLGDWRDSVTVEKHRAGSVVTQQLFASFAPGGVREALGGVLSAWTNKPYGNYRFANYGKSTLTNFEQRLNGFILASHCWEEDCDLSGVSFLNDDKSYWWTQPATLVASNLAYGAAHWSRGKGSRIAWIGKDGNPHVSSIVDQRRMEGDLCLSKLSPPLDTNLVTAYPILELRAAVAHTDTGSAKVYDLPPLPVLAMAQGQRAWIMQSSGHWDTEGTRGYYGGVSGIFDYDAGKYIRNSRQYAVGGDSGHPCLTTTDGTHLVLIGAYWTQNGVSTPGDDTSKPLIIEAATAMGADPAAIQWETWDGWPTYLGPGLNMGGGTTTSSSATQGE